MEEPGSAADRVAWRISAWPIASSTMRRSRNSPQIQDRCARAWSWGCPGGIVAAFGVRLVERCTGCPGAACVLQCRGTVTCDGALLRLQEAPEHRCASVAEHRAVSAREYGGHPSPLVSCRFPWPTAYTPRKTRCSRPVWRRTWIARRESPAASNCATEITPCCLPAMRAARASGRGLAPFVPIRFIKRQNRFGAPASAARNRFVASHAHRRSRDPCHPSEPRPCLA